MINFFKKLIGPCRTSKVDYTTVGHHTGYYILRPTAKFKINGIPCVVQQGHNEMIFFTETNITNNINVTPVKIL